MRPQPVHGNAETRGRRCRADASSRIRDTARRAPLRPPLRRRARRRSRARASSSARSAAPLSSDARVRLRCRPRGRRRGRRPSSAAAALSTARSRCGPFSPASTARSTCAFVGRRRRRRAAAARRVRCRDRAGRSRYACSGPSVSSCTVLVVVVVSSSRPSSPENTIARSVPSSRSAPEHARRHRRVGHAHCLPPHPRRVRERAEEVEGGGHADLGAGRAEEPHRRVVPRREAEPDTGLLDAPRDARRDRASIATPSSSSTSADPPATTRRGCRASRRARPHRPRSSAAMVETLTVPERSPPVPHVSIAPSGTSTGVP